MVFWHKWTSDWEKVIGRICDEFNRSQDQYEVVPLSMGSASLKILISTAGGDPPDCMAEWDPVIPAWADKGVLTPLDTLMGPGEWE